MKRFLGKKGLQFLALLLLVGTGFSWWNRERGLSRAVRSHQPLLTAWFLALGADPNHRTNGFYMIEEALPSPWVVYLLIQAGAETRVTVYGGGNLLHEALTRATRDDDLVETLKILIQEGVNVNRKDAGGNTPVFFLDRLRFSGTDSEEIFQILVKAGADLQMANSWGETPLMMAVESGDVRVAKRMIALGANPKVCDRKGNTLLHAAATGESEAMVDLVLRLGIDPEQANRKGEVPFHQALRYGNQAVVKRLLRQGVKGNDPTGAWRFPVHLVVGPRVPDQEWKLKMLVGKGADINAIDSRGLTPLLRAMLYRDNDWTLRLLLEHHADPNRKGALGVTPLVLARHRRETRLEQILLEAGAGLPAELGPGGTLAAEIPDGLDHFLREILTCPYCDAAAGEKSPDWFCATCRDTGYVDFLE